MSYDEEIEEKLRDMIFQGQVRVDRDSQKIANDVSRIYPFCGSAIAWSQIEGSVRIKANSQSLEEDKLTFFGNIIREHDLNGEAVVLSDGDFEYAYFIGTRHLENYLDVFLEYPQPLYILSSDLSWCMVFSMDDFMSFGRVGAL